MFNYAYFAQLPAKINWLSWLSVDVNGSRQNVTVRGWADIVYKQFCLSVFLR